MGSIRQRVNRQFWHAGRKDLFTVLDMQHPAKPSDDAWMGNMLVDPARGKAHAPGPEERMGRSGLFDVMQQKILLEAQQGGRHGTGAQV